MTLPNPVLSSSTFQTVYFGQPGAMTKTPVPDVGITVPLDRAEGIHKLAGGGNTISRARYLRRTYTLEYANRTHDEMDPLLAYYYGTMGPGPFALMIPGWRNLQDIDVSTMGVRTDGQVGWDTTFGDTNPVFSTAVAPPLPNTGVLAWASPVNTHLLVEGTLPTGGNYIPNAAARPYAVPYLADQPFTLSLYARTASSTCNARSFAAGQIAAGGSMVSTAGTTVGLTTAWQRLSVVVPIGAAGWSAAATSYISVGLQCQSAGAPTIYVAASQIEAGVSAPGAWLTGMGCPRVVIPPVNTSLVVFPRRSQTLTLLET